MSQRDTRLIGGIYRIGQAISGGGILTTYTAYNRMTHDVVGLSIITFPPTISAETVQRHLQLLEQRRAVQSSHVLAVHNWGIDSNRAYIVTDPPRGITLQHVLDNENIDIARALDLTKQIAMGIKDLHEKGIVGLDLRPQLITIDSVGITDRLQIDDIGLRSLLYALGYSNNQQMNAISALDPHYATPEHINRGQIGPWSDIYQSGLLLFDLVTGRLPFVGRTPAETGIMQSTSPIPHMTQYTHKTPHVLQEIVDCSLAKEPSKRFANAGALLNALEAIQLSPLPDHPVTAQITQPAQASTSLTKEIEPIKEDDVTLRETIIESYQPAPPAVRQTLLAEDALAYLCYEQNERIAIKLKSTIVGRIDPKRGYTPDIDLSKFDPKMTISRQHARISFAETFFYIEDLKSRNKTRLGALPLTPFKGELLQHGDIIHFGSVRMSFELPGMAKVPVFKER